MTLLVLRRAGQAARERLISAYKRSRRLLRSTCVSNILLLKHHLLTTDRDYFSSILDELRTFYIIVGNRRRIFFYILI